MQHKYVPQKNSQNRKLLREALAEGNPPSHSYLKMTSRGPELRPPFQSILAWTPNHPAQDGPYWAIPPAGGSAGPLAAYYRFRQSLGRLVALLIVPFLGETQHALKLCKRNGRLSLVSGDIMGTRSAWKLFGAAEHGPAAFSKRHKPSLGKLMCLPLIPTPLLWMSLTKSVERCRTVSGTKQSSGCGSLVRRYLSLGKYEFAVKQQQRVPGRTPRGVTYNTKKG
ncbi:hypothetical protein E2C01_052603 [Portunus trituberculatus]|uniref:Uncharacterized protein n=1 Tax=Portunus trituberculatus TaxID=210409 RepID=A0A5B7GLY3_PORTR|nr:hypothetical protein [Portunus trituberculatus]